MKKTIWYFLLCVYFIATNTFDLFSQENRTSDFINSVYYNNRLSIIRTSYDRWSVIFNTYWKDDPDPYKTLPIQSAVNDFNWGIDANGKSIYPMTIGYALGKKYVRYYFLLNSSDLPNLWKKKDDMSDGNFNAATVGMNFNFKFITVQGDVTYSGRNFDYYGKIFSQYTKTHIGVGFGNYSELKDTLIKIVESKKPSFSQLDFSTSLIKYFNVGFRYLNISRVRYMPNINTSLHQLVKFERWNKMPFDLELFFETRGEKIENIFNMKDWETRLVYYQFLGEPLMSQKTSKGNTGISNRPAVFLGISYKSEEDGFTQTLTESGKAYNGQHGVGFEAGICLRVLGFTQFGFKDASYVKFSGFYNYSQYFERSPGIKAGIKFRVLM